MGYYNLSIRRQSKHYISKCSVLSLFFFKQIHHLPNYKSSISTETFFRYIFGFAWQSKPACKHCIYCVKFVISPLGTEICNHCCVSCMFSSHKAGHAVVIVFSASISILQIHFNSHMQYGQIGCKGALLRSQLWANVSLVQLSLGFCSGSPFEMPARLFSLSHDETKVTQISRRVSLNSLSLLSTCNLEEMNFHCAFVWSDLSTLMLILPTCVH